MSKGKKPAFDWKTALEAIEMSGMLKAGVKYYIESYKLTPKSDKDLEKIIDDFKKVKMGD